MAAVHDVPLPTAAQDEDRREAEARSRSRTGLVLLLLLTVALAAAVVGSGGSLLTPRPAVWAVLVASVAGPALGRTLAIRAARWATWRAYYTGVAVLFVSIGLFGYLLLGWPGRAH